LRAAQELSQAEQGNLQRTYQCIVTPFGTQGYFHTPATIFINSQLRHPGSPFLTMLHELTHLILFEQTKDYPADKLEKKIDTVTHKYFGDFLS